MSTAVAHHCPTGRHPEPHYCCYHGHHCRCAGCTECAVADNRRRRRDRAYGRWQARLVDAAPTRALLAVLRDAGGTQAWVQEHTGLTGKTQWEIGSRRRQRVQRSTARKVAAFAHAVGNGDVHTPGYQTARRRELDRLRRREYRRAS